ncbi:hypothetical protein F5146DRAFT_997587 [Armillaria mellea]|nr:hypothetical protein F5146DRAFT_997587 [Armillaria mellea]
MLELCCEVTFRVSRARAIPWLVENRIPCVGRTVGAVGSIGWRVTGWGDLTGIGWDHLEQYREASIVYSCAKYYDAQSPASNILLPSPTALSMDQPAKTRVRDVVFGAEEGMHAPMRTNPRYWDDTKDFRIPGIALNSNLDPTLDVQPRNRTLVAASSFATRTTAPAHLKVDFDDVHGVLVDLENVGVGEGDEETEVLSKRFSIRSDANDMHETRKEPVGRTHFSDLATAFFVTIESSKFLTAELPCTTATIPDPEMGSKTDTISQMVFQVATLPDSSHSHLERMFATYCMTAPWDVYLCRQIAEWADSLSCQRDHTTETRAAVVSLCDTTLHVKSSNEEPNFVKGNRCRVDGNYMSFCRPLQDESWWLRP